MRRFAEGTTTSIDATLRELQKTLERYGAKDAGFAVQGRAGVLWFTLQERRIRIAMAPPDPNAKTVRLTATGQRRSLKQVEAYLDGEARRRWRVLVLVLKAQLEAIASGVVTVEEQFLNYVVLPDNSTVGETVRENVAEAYRTGVTQPMLPGLPRTALPEGDKS